MYYGPQDLPLHSYPGNSLSQAPSSQSLWLIVDLMQVGGKYPVKGTPQHLVVRPFPAQGAVAQLVELVQPEKSVPNLLVRKCWTSTNTWDELDTYQSLGKQPYFPTLYYWDQTGDNRVIFIEYCPCKGLDQAVVATDGEAKKMFTELLTALKTLHDREIIHRDIKPKNIYKTADGNFKVLDFGSALHWRECSNLAVLSGNTPNYFCGKIGGLLKTLSRDEQIAVLKKRDIWSLGKSLLECLGSTGMLDFSSKTEEQLMMIVSQRLREKWNEYIPILMLMLSYDPRKGADAGKLLPMLGRSLSLRSTSSSNSQDSPPIQNKDTQVNGQLAIQRVRASLQLVEIEEMRETNTKLNKLLLQPNLIRDPVLQHLTRLGELKQRGVFGQFRVERL